jgi:serine protease Do
MKTLIEYGKIAMAALIGGMVAIGAAEWNKLGTDQGIVSRQVDSNHSVLHVSDRAMVAYDAPDLTVAAEDAVESVVHVQVTAEGEEYYQVDPFQYFFFGQPNGRRYKMPDRSGAGSGVIISQDGYIVTNNHVINGADEIKVVLNDNRSYEAKVIGADPSTDLALLKIDENNLDPLVIGNSDDIRLGEWVIAVGNPLNLNSTVTAGIVSAKARSINILQTGNGQNPPLEAFIQTDAAVNPGNSGGALVSVNGELIGINAAIKSPTGSFTGYSFAIPSNIVKKVVGDLLEYGVVQRAFIGVNIRNIDDQLREEVDVPISSGAYVAGLTDGGAAKDAGIEEGDVIIGVGELSVNNVAELQEQIGRFKPGDEVNVVVNRDGVEKTIPVILRNLEGEAKLIEKPANQDWIALGGTMRNLKKEEQEKLNLRGGVKITEINGGKLRKAGIREGFVITEIDNQEVKDLDELNEMLSEKSGGVLIGGVYPNGEKKYYGIGL